MNVSAMRFCLHGDLNLAALRRSFCEVVRRHELLRTNIVVRHGQPVQIIHPPKSVEIPFTDHGSFVFLGRRDHQVKIRGYRVNTREVETVLLQQNEVAEAAVVVPELDAETQLVAFLVLKPGYEVDAPGLRDRLRAHLPDWKIPARVHMLAAMPTTLTGKIDRRRLGEESRELAATLASSSTPESAEEEIAAIRRDALRVDAVNRSTSFLNLGGDSMSAMTAANRVEQRFGVRVDFVDFLRHPSIEQLAQRIRQETL